MHKSVFQAKKYGENEEFATKIRSMQALALVPVADIESVWDGLLSTNYFPEEAENIVYYFEKNYIGRYLGRLRNFQFFI